MSEWMVIPSPHGDWPRIKLGSGSTLAFWRVAANSFLIFIPGRVKIILAVKFSKENLENTLHSHK